MTTIYEHKGFSWSFFLWGILFIVIALIAFRDPLGNIAALTTLFGIMAILGGVWFLTHRFGSNFRLLIGVLEILIGVYLIVNPTGGAEVIAMVFALWFILDSVSNLFALNYYRTFGEGYYRFMLVVNIIGVLVGAVLFLQPAIVMFTLSFLIGFYFLLAGISYILLAFSNPTIRVDDDTIDV